MRSLVLLAVGAALVAAVPAPAQKGGLLYRIEMAERNVFSSFRDRNGQKGLYITLQIKVLRTADGQVATDVSKDEIVVTEDGKRVEELEIFAPRAQSLTPVLALDTSGSMRGSGKIDQARKAAATFLDRLDSRADVGLILFNHEILPDDPTRVLPPAREPSRSVAHRQQVRALIDRATARGGTAYLDATAHGVRMLREVRGRKAVVVLTDGVDLSSKHPLDEVIEQAVTAEVPVYTLGIGEAGSSERVSTVLVLDRSGSMKGKASDTDTKTKLDALKEAATRFVDLMRPGAFTTLLPFSSTVERPRPFTDDRQTLHGLIGQLEARGGTVLYDATLDGIETLVAARPEGRKAVVVLTDGKDESPGSRHSPGAVIARAREEGIKLYMLGLGAPREINEAVMRRMAQETGGEYFHADSQQRLVEVFEDLSLRLHDDGIDEASLRKLATDTGGKYYHIRDVSQLEMVYEELAEELQSTYTITFRSRRQSHDGTARGIEVSVMRDGEVVSDVVRAAYNVHGVVVPEMSPSLYLLLLGVLVALLAIPALLRSLVSRTPA